jgi:FHS family Na+ dependent glucose MFS transporter 1
LAEISFLFTAVSLGYLVGSLLGGRQYDRVPGHLLMAANLLVMAFVLAIAPLVPQIWILALVMVVLGIAEGTVDVGGNTLIVWVHGRRVGPYMNALHFCWGFGAFLFPIIVSQALSISGGIRWSFWILAVLVLPVAAWLLRLPSPAPPAAGPGQAGGTTALDQPDRSTQERLAVVLVTLLLFLFVGAEGGFGGWIYSYALAFDLASATVAAYLTSAYWGALTVGRLLGIPIARWLRPRWILLIDAVGCLLSAAVLLLWPGSPLATWVSTLGMGLFMASAFPAALTLAERRVAITGRITSWFLVGASLGGMTLPLLMGQLFESAGPQSAMALLVLYLAMALAILLVLTFRSQRRLSNI